jgi:hypothetical protein
MGLSHLAVIEVLHRTFGKQKKEFDSSVERLAVSWYWLLCGGFVSVLTHGSSFHDSSLTFQTPPKCKRVKAQNSMG